MSTLFSGRRAGCERMDNLYKVIMQLSPLLTLNVIKSLIIPVGVIG